MPVYVIDPLQDPRWNELLARHPEASVFHTPAWLLSLRETYGYNSFVLTTTAPSQALENGIVLTAVKSWLTGSRLISVPFADHCQPLVDDADQLAVILESLNVHRLRTGCKSLELRPSRQLPIACSAPWFPSEHFVWHNLHIRPELGTLLSRFDKTSVRQMIRRASREGVRMVLEPDEAVLQSFYKLLVSTRRRHGVPPQPLEWFEALKRNFGDSLQIRVALYGHIPIASILTLSFKHTLVYKYSCSDVNWNRLGGTPYLLWNAIEEARDRGVTTVDLGRTETANSGLIAFKDHWDAESTQLCYYRTRTNDGRLLYHSRNPAWARKLLSALPDSCLIAAGRIVYRHVG